jgi:hypothetical protein
MLKAKKLKFPLSAFSLQAFLHTALDRAIKHQYLRWLRASSRPPTLPPRA